MEKQQKIQRLKADIKEAKHILSLLVKEEYIISVKKQIKQLEQELKELENGNKN